jgi:hypothetical protein
MNVGAKNANEEMFRRAVSSNFATVINKLQRIIELLEAQVAQQSVHLTGGTVPLSSIDQRPEVDSAGEDNQRPATSR